MKLAALAFIIVLSAAGMARADQATIRTTATIQNAAEIGADGHVTGAQPVEVVVVNGVLEVRF